MRKIIWILKNINDIKLLKAGKEIKDSFLHCLPYSLELIPKIGGSWAIFCPCRITILPLITAMW